MRLREKGKKDGEVVTLGWDEAQAALQAGTHEVVDDSADGGAISGEKGPEPEPEPDKGDDLEGKTRAELAAMADERGFEVASSASKADLIKALRSA